MNSRISYLLLLLVAISTALCASPPSFCKCTCFSNSTIIPLSAPPSTDTPSSDTTSTTSSSTSSSGSHSLRSLFTLNNLNINFLSHAKDADSSKPNPKKQRTCTDCNRQFCLSYNLPICKDVKLETDVVATCFQRDSTKDQVVVFVFVAGTVGLLVWSLVGAFVGVWWEKLRGRHSYNPVAG